MKTFKEKQKSYTKDHREYLCFQIRHTFYIAHVNALKMIKISED